MYCNGQTMIKFKMFYRAEKTDDTKTEHISNQVAADVQTRTNR